MTPEEKSLLLKDICDMPMRSEVVPHFAADWCNKNHFDYRCLIPIGLNLEAPEDMYNTKTE